MLTDMFDLPDIYVGQDNHPEKHNIERSAIKTLNSRWKGYYNVLESGAVGNNIVDDTDAILNSIISCGTNGILFFPSGYYSVSDTLLIKCHVQASPNAYLVYKGSADKPCVVLGDGNLVYYRSIRLPRIVASTQLWGENAIGESVGIRINGIFGSFFSIPLVHNFGTGIYVTDTTGNGTAFNTVMLGVLADNGIQIKVRAEHALGWMNQFLWLGGQLATTGQEIVGGTKQIYLDRLDGGYYPDEHTFVGTDVEGYVPEYHLDLRCRECTFESLRYEAGAGINPRIVFRSGAHNNNIHGGSFLSPRDVIHEQGTINNVVQPRETAIYRHSPDMSLWRITVDNAGNVVTEKQQ